LLKLIKGPISGGSDDFVELVSELIRNHRVTPDLDVSVLFSGVVPDLCSLQKYEGALMGFVAQIAGSDIFSPTQQQQIIWGTHDANPTLAKNGHWKLAGACERAALLAGIVSAVQLHAPNAERLLPRDLNWQYWNLKDAFTRCLVNDQKFAAVTLPVIWRYLDRSAAPPPEPAMSALLPEIFSLI
jgi:hypothetical protein